MNILKKIFGKKEVKKAFSQEEFDKDYELKMAGLDFIMGKSADFVGHAIIPFFDYRSL